MALDPIHRLKHDLHALNCKPNRLKGQNFLIDPVVRDTLVETALLGPGDQVLEIGAGTGIITWKLEQSGCKVIGLEIESHLTGLLKDRFSNNPAVEIIQTEANRWLKELCLAGAISGRLKIVSSLPYSLSSPILTTVARFSQHFSRIVLILQKEVAERIAAKPHGSNRSVLSVLIQSRFIPSILQTIKSPSFYPPPKVDSTMLVLDPREAPCSVPWDLWKRTVELCFSQKRKKVSNNLKNILSSIEMSAIREALSDVLPQRAEALAEEDFIRLANELRTLIPER
jgi:16S rRNA (adenine1518-N6/adenine1519-N6)-dimethyltransferase